MDILEFIRQMQEIYGEDVITTADKLEKPPKTVVREMFQNAFKDNKADGGRAGYNDGQLVTPSADGSRPGYMGKSKLETKTYQKEYYEKNKKLTASGKLAAERDIKLKNFLGKKKTIKSSELRPFLENLGYKKIDNSKLKKKFPNLKIIKDIQPGFLKGTTTKYDKKALNVANRYANLLHKRNPNDRHYVNASKYMKLNDKGKKKIIQIMNTNNNKFNKDFSAQLRFNEKKEKLLIKNFGLTEDDFVKHGKYGVVQTIDGKRNPKYTSIFNFVKNKFKFRKVRKSEMVTLNQQEFIKNNFELPEGKEWNFKSQDNPNGYKYGITGTKKSGTANLAKRIEKRMKNKKLSYTVAADTSSPKGWMMNAMNRLYEREIEAGVKPENLTYKPKFDKKGIIIGFTDTTAAGGNKTYYGLNKNTPEDATAWTAHGDHEKIKKFLKIAKGAQVDDPSKLLQKILDDKGITKLMGDKNVLTLNDILSHERYYKNLSDIAPTQLIKRQIVLHHSNRIGSKDLARAAATQDIQLLTGAVNSEVRKLETIASKRKLNAGEKLKLKNYGARIADFDGKIVGGGFIDPEKQYKAIEKGAIDYAKSDQFNVKTVASYLERLGCGNAAGGRILMKTGGATLTKCANKGTKKLEQIILRGGANKTEQDLAKKILQAGRGLRGMFSLSGMFGPAATAFLVGTEAGLVGYDMISQGKTFREAVGDSVFNYALGDRTKIYPKEERYKGYAAAGVDKDTIGKISAFENAMDEVKNMQQEFEKEDVAYRDAVISGPRMSGAIKQKQIKNYYDQVKKNQELIKYLEQPQTQEKLKIVDDDLFPAMMSDADAKRRAMQMTKPLTVGFGNTMDFLFPKATYRKDRERAINYMPAVQEYYRGGQFANGGLASLTDTIPPESGPMSQGLRSLYNNDMDY